MFAFKFSFSLFGRECDGVRSFSRAPRVMDTGGYNGSTFIILPWNGITLVMNELS